MHGGPGGAESVGLCPQRVSNRFLLRVCIVYLLLIVFSCNIPLRHGRQFASPRSDSRDAVVLGGGRERGQRGEKRA